MSLPTRNAWSVRGHFIMMVVTMTTVAGLLGAELSFGVCPTAPAATELPTVHKQAHNSRESMNADQSNVLCSCLLALMTLVHGR